MAPTLHPFEPEETVGRVWHAFASRLDPAPEHAAAAVALEGLAARLGVVFRAFGGDPSVEIGAAACEPGRHRAGWRRRLAEADERVALASFDGGVLRLPARIALLPEPRDNRALYLWLAAFAAHLGPAVWQEADPLRADLATIAAAEAATAAALACAPGLRADHARLAAAVLGARRARSATPVEAAVEALVVRHLGGATPTGRAAGLVRLLATPRAQWPDTVRAPNGYRPFAPVPLWVVWRAPRAGTGTTEDEAAGGPGQELAHARTLKARRRPGDLAERSDSLILHRFEALLSFASFANVNRRVDDDDPATARRALDDLDEVALARVSRVPATRLKLHLDLSPADIDRERLAARTTYREWDHRARAYLPDHACVLASDAPEAPCSLAEAHALRRIAAVRRRFEALRPRPVMLPRQSDGEELDLDEAVRSAADFAACGGGSDRLWRARRPVGRDLAVAILLDVSRSTESAVGGRSVIEIEREALTAFAWGLHAVGDVFAIHAFSSLRRHRVSVLKVKSFDEAMGGAVERRIAGLTPGFYTRLGTAIRHVATDLSRRRASRRLLLVITDGKPNDLDHYEGRHGIEDSRMAVREARRAGNAVFALAIDGRASAHLPRLFGRGGFACVSQADRLTAALPGIYRHLVGA